MNYKNIILGPLITAVGGSSVAVASNVLTLQEGLLLITAASTTTIAFQLYRWADVQE